MTRLTILAIIFWGLSLFVGEIGTGAEGNEKAKPVEAKIILTPKPGPKPRINGPKVYGVRMGHPFIYRIPATGKRPMKFKAENLPSSMSLDAKTGIITGKGPKKYGDHIITLIAENQFGRDSRSLKIVVGETLALTPPMGWNSWYIHYYLVNEQHMHQAAEAMVASGMADYGYMYVNIDDCWMKKRDNEPYRDQNGAVLTNKKFPDIKGMVDYIHSKGLKAGIYTSPGPWTCAGYVGSYQHEVKDAQKFAEWGFDFLKYDWCSYTSVASGEGLERLQIPYRLMADILMMLDRDIVFNLCQYGMGEVWKWGGEVGGNCWRTTGDLGLAKKTQLPGFYHIGLANARHWEYAKCGQWNDPDYILIGWVGDAHEQSEGHATTLTGNEQYSYMSMWCLMAAPLIFSGDMAKLDDFTLNILCNAEVIEVDQDPLGQQGKIISQTDEQLVLAKKMEDGSLAVGLFNLSEKQSSITVNWSDLGINGLQRVRDLWRQRDEKKPHNDKYQIFIPRHGVKLIRLFPIDSK